MTLSIVRIANPITATWTRGRATLTTYHFDKSKTGRRVNVYVWLDEGVIEVSAIKGDGRDPSCVKFAPVEMTVEEARAANVDYLVLATQTANSCFHD